MNEFFSTVNPLFLMGAVIVVGMGVGSLKIKGFSLESSAIIFVGMLVGHLGGELPKMLQTMGLILFIYSIGLQAGPGFISSFRESGLKLSLGAFLLVTLGFAFTLIGAKVLNYSGGIAAGVFAGSLTSSPGLAVAVEMSGPEKAPAAYGVTYVFGVVGVILFVKILPILMKIKISDEEDILKKSLDQKTESIERFHIRITNPNISGKRMNELNLGALAKVSFTRILKPGAFESELVTDDTVLEKGDLLRVVSSREEMDKILFTLGEVSDELMPSSKDMSNRRILVSKKELTGRTIASLNFRNAFSVTISRYARNGIEFPITPDVKLQIGDRLTLVGSVRSLDRIEKVLGNDIESTFKADVLVMIIGLAFGFIIGRIPIVIPGVTTFSLGLAGGTLTAALILGGIYSTGRFVWILPAPTNEFIRNLGLYMFLAVVGVSAGSSIVETIHQQGVALLLFGAVVTILTLLFGFLLCSKLLKISFMQTLGVMTGGMTSTPGLAATSSLSKTHFIAAAYATVYPVAMIAMIIYTKVLVNLL